LNGWRARARRCGGRRAVVEERGCGVAPASSAGLSSVRRRSRQWVRPSLRRSTVPERERVPGERRLGAVRGPGNAAQREASTPVLMFDRVRSRPSPGAWVECALRMPAWRFGGVPSGTGVTEPTYVCLSSSSTPPKALPATIVCKCPGTRTGNTVGRHKSQRTAGGPGSQGRSALTTGSTGVD
jgi:hypothetical protein